MSKQNNTMNELANENRMTGFYDCVQGQNILTIVLSKLGWSYILEAKMEQSE